MPEQTHGTEGRRAATGGRRLDYPLVLDHQFLTAQYQTHIAHAVHYLCSFVTQLP